MKQTGHLRAPRNWINDPNGFIFYKGQYHVFYQHFPYEPRWGTMHWGHAVSKDLLHWEHTGIALFPTKIGDQNGCFSGSAVEHEGKLHLFYTGVRYLEVNPENVQKPLNNNFESCQMTIVSEDGEHFDNLHSKRVIIPPLSDQSIGDRTLTRDPKVWRGSDAWYMVVGSSSYQKGKLLFFKSSDLYNWELANQTSRDGFGWMWECPDYFEVNGSGVLLCSPMGYMKDGKAPEDMALCALARFDEKTCSMEIAEDYQFFDYGLDLYAPQSTLDADGNRTVIAWLRMPQPVENSWQGMMCLPRLVEVIDGHIYFRMHPQIARQYTRRIDDPSEATEGGYRLSLELEDGESLDIGGFVITREYGRIRTDRSAVCPDTDKCRMRAETPVVHEGSRLDIYVDGNIVEIYVNDGEYTLTQAVYDLDDRVTFNGAGAIELFALA